MVPAKAPTKGSMKAGVISKVSENALRNTRLKVDWIWMEPGKTMAFLKARWKSKASLKVTTKVEPKDAGSLPNSSEKVQTRVQTTEAVSPPQVSVRGVISKVSEKAWRNASLKANWSSMEPGKTMAFLTACWKS